LLVEPDGLLLMRGDEHITSLSYLQFVEGYRTDVAAVDVELLKLPTYVDDFERRFPDMDPTFESYAEEDASLVDLVSAGLETRSVFAVGDMPEDLSERFDVIRLGLVDEIRAKAEVGEYDALLSNPALVTSLDRGPFAPIEHGGVRYGLRAHELRRFLDLPLRTGAPFRLALDIDPADAADRERLLAAGWELEDPVANAGDLDSYRDFIARSAGEIMIAKGLYVATRNGWFSDRSVCYLASGRPVLAQDTGWSERYPSGEGLIAFRDLDEAVEAVAEARRDPARHRRAARARAEAYFDSDLVLTRLAARAAAPRARPVEAAGGGWRP
ncbi:MAG: glycosyltransferase, partial [Gemmatimonadota bacterium]|nr:glycosyltransferase [Gemmatimonadota bacterium]